ncbi:MAG: hypothetical protein NVS9B10_19930 [Nevskia sp.]
MPSAAHLIICEYCDTVHRRPELEPGGSARCLACGGPLVRKSRFDVDAMLALTAASAIVFVIANVYPIVIMESQGITTQTTLWSMVISAWDSGIALVAAIAALTVMVFPLLQISLYLYVLPGLRGGRLPAEFNGAMRLLRQLRPWSMVEVFLIGTLVSVVKMQSLAEVSPQPGLWGFGLLTVLLTALGSFDLRELWLEAAERSA